MNIRSSVIVVAVLSSILLTVGCGKHITKPKTPVVEPPKPPATTTYSAFSRGTPGGNECNGNAGFMRDSAWFYYGYCNRGFNICIIDTATCQVLVPGVRFDTWAHDENKTRMIAYLDTIPAGRLIMVAVCDDAGLDYEPTAPINGEVRAFFERMGSAHIRDYVFRDSWAFITVKGSGVALAEAFAKHGQRVTASTTLTLKP